MIIERRNSFIKSYWIKIGGGVAGSYGGTGNHYIINLTTLTGANNSHLEFNAGIFLLYYHDNTFDNYIGPTAAVGYRFQKPNGYFVFRTGIGIPDAVYLILGFCF